MRIEPLSADHLEDAIQLLERVSPQPSDEPARCSLTASIFPERMLEYLEKSRIVNPRYWVLLDGRDVMGVSGLHERAGDDETIVGGWTGVDERCRRSVAAGRLLHMTWQQAKLSGRAFLRLWTTDCPEHLPARRLYERHGMRLYRQTVCNGVNRIHYELPLRP